RALGAATEQGELLSQRQVLKNEVRAGSQPSAQSAQQSEYEVHCRLASPPCRSTSSVQIEFWPTTPQGGQRSPSSLAFVLPPMPHVALPSSTSSAPWRRARVRS